MTRALRLAALVLLAGASAPALAQTQANPARLDDFAVGATADDPSHVEQLAPADDRPQSPSQPRDRTVAAPEPQAPRTTTLRQISRPDQPPEQSQLTATGGAPDETAAAVSSTADSRPQAVARLGGNPEDDGTTAGAVHRGWINLKEAVLGRDDEAIVNSVESGEDYLKEKFETALKNTDLPAEARSAVEQAWQSVKAGHDQMSQLKHAIS